MLGLSLIGREREIERGTNEGRSSEEDAALVRDDDVLVGHSWDVGAPYIIVGSRGSSVSTLDTAVS